MKNQRRSIISLLFRSGVKPEEFPNNEYLVPSPFIVGVGRSGTTLLRLMLDAHPDLAIPPETHFIPGIAAANKRPSNPHRTFLETLKADQMWGDHGIDDLLLEQRIYEIKPFDLSAALRTFYRLYAERFRKPRWGDKTPRYLLHMKLIASILPEARFIHIIRDGRDVALSLQGVWFGPKTIEEAAHWWKSWVQQAQGHASELPHYLEIRYEDLLLHTTSTLKTICSFIALPWNTSMLDYHLTAEERLKEKDRDVISPESKRLIPASERTAIHSFTSQPPQPSRINRWKTEMSDLDRKTFEDVAGDMLQELGYDVS